MTLGGKQPRPAYIYGLKDPRDGQIHYVGKADDPERRKQQHIEDISTNSARVEWINGLLDNGLEPDVVILEKTSSKEWREAEVYWIALGHEEGWPLVNLHKGGNGGCRGFSAPSPPDYSFMRSYMHPSFWGRFEALAMREKNDVCLKTGQAMANSYAPFLKRKMAQHQYAMHSIIDDELVWIGMQIATMAVASKTGCVF